MKALACLACAAILCASIFTFSGGNTATSVAVADEVGVELDANKSYSDTAGHWATREGWINKVTQKGLMTGYSGTTRFGPNDTLSREQAATILYRYANPGSKASTDPAQFGIETFFVDVYLNTFSTEPIDWCFENGIVNGYTNSSGNLTGRFGPFDPITREQIATIIFRFAQNYRGAATDTSTGKVSKIADYGSVSSWAKDAVAYCYNAGIMTGRADTHLLDPKANVTRAEMAKIICVVSDKGI